MAKSDYGIREQSLVPRIACKALRKFANFLGRGKKIKRKLTMAERLQYEVLKALKGSKYAKQVRNVGASETDSDSFYDSDS